MLNMSETYEADLAAADAALVRAEVDLIIKAGGTANFLRTHAATVSVETLIKIADELEQAVSAHALAKSARLDVIFPAAEAL